MPQHPSLVLARRFLHQRGGEKAVLVNDSSTPHPRLYDSAAGASWARPEGGTDWASMLLPQARCGEPLGGEPVTWVVPESLDTSNNAAIWFSRLLKGTTRHREPGAGTHRDCPLQLPPPTSATTMSN
jgi:hypothetical protein